MHTHTHTLTHTHAHRSLLYPKQPKIAEKFLGSGSSFGYVLEDSVIDPAHRMMRTVTRNISFAKVLCVEETCTYTVSKENSDWYVRWWCVCAVSYTHLTLPTN